MLASSPLHKKIVPQRQLQQQRHAERRRKRFFSCESLEARNLMAGLTDSTASNVWQTLDEIPVSPHGATSYLALNEYSALTLNEELLRAQLAAAPLEFTAAADNPLEFWLPNPSGGMTRFALVESPVMAPELAAQFPDIKTYAGQGIDDTAQSVRLDLTPHGFHAQVLSPNGSFYIDPYYHLDTSAYVSYYRSGTDADARRELLGDFPFRNELVTAETLGTSRTLVMGPLSLEQLLTTTAPIFMTEAESQAALLASAKPTANVTSPSPFSALSAGEDTSTSSKGKPTDPRERSGTFVRTYRAAIAATAEYTIFHGGTVPLGMAAVVTAMNRVSGVFASELSIRFELVPNNQLLIYTEPTLDPYTNNNPVALINENQTSLDSRIGDANYDIGHVLTTAGGDFATIRSVGVTGLKGQGTSGIPNPIGDPFWIDFLAHDIGRQFGANRTWSGDSGSCTVGGFNPPTGVEPGSGSTIMAFAGFCGNDDLQPNNDANFSAASFDEIIAYVDTVIPTVGTRTMSGNSIPAVNAGQDYVIPTNTPFTLTAVGADADPNDTLTYSWEQLDAGPQRDLGAADPGIGAWFRVRPPVTSPQRSFPQLPDLLLNNPAIGEFLPTVARIFDFRVTVRDNKAGGAGINTDDMRLKTINTGAPFRVTSPNSAVHWAAKSTQTVSWNVSGTNANGINTSHVNILLSTDGGNTFPITLASNVPNDGVQLVNIPDLPFTTTARVRVEPVGNIYYDISDTNFFIDPPPPPMDFGDAPDPLYPTLLANNGARHTIGGPRLGSLVDGDNNGQPSNFANADGLDDDGVAIITPLIAGQTATIQVNSSAAGAKLDYFFDFDANGVFGNTPSEVFSATLTSGSQLLVIDVPAAATLGNSYARFRISSAGGLGPAGLAADGEVEDYVITILGALPPMDFGDAPNNYGTLATSAGPRHMTGGGLFLGTTVDADPVALPNLTSTGDGADDDGVKFPQLLIPGTNVNVQITASTAGTLNYFFDFDGSGVFADQPNEGFQAAISAGTTTIVVPVPASAFVGKIAARFRLSTAGNLGPYGFASDGEVEDYQVRTIAVNVTTPFENFDGVVAPALPVGWTQVSTPVGGAPVNWITRDLGSDTPNNHAFVPSANYASTNTLTSPAFTVTSFNQRIRFQHSYQWQTYFDGGRMEISINGNPFVDIVSAGGVFVSGGYHNNINTGFGNSIGGQLAWTGNSSDFFESTITLPPNSLGQSVRLRWTEGTDSTTTEVGWKLDSIIGQRVAIAFDYGDAPGPFPTTAAGGGAAHAAETSLRLGTLFDTEFTGTPNGTATGDDGATSADEDGVTFNGPVAQGNQASLTVVASADALLQAWFDFNDDGDWNDPGEQVFADLPVTAGANNLTFLVPASAVVSPQTFARFRLSTQAGLLVTGQAPDGEVEDYQLVLAAGNVLPTINPISDLVISEDAGPQIVNFNGISAGGIETQSIHITASSNNPTLIPNPSVNYTSPGQAGSLSFAPTANQFGFVSITVLVRDAGVDGVLFNADDGFSSTGFNVTVNSVNDPPAFTRGADQVIPMNSGPQSVFGWANNITPGASNEAAQSVSFQITENSNSALFATQPAISPSGTLSYTPAANASGLATITVIALDSAGGVSAPQTFNITLTGLLSFQVLTFAPTSTGATLTFNRDFDQLPLNLYDVQGGSAADVILQGASAGNVRGSLYVNAAARQLTFVSTTGTLPADTYTLTLRSAADALRDLNGELLDGNADGTPGGNFVQSFIVNPPAANVVTVSIPNVARGPQQPVNMPANVASAGLPISMSSAAGVTSLTFQLRYDPTLLTISGATRANGLPAGSAVTYSFPSSGLMNINFTSTEPISGDVRFADLQATVPSTAPYRSKAVLDISNISVNSNAIPAIDDDGLQIVAYLGDATANGTYSSQDASRISRVAVGLDGGFQLYKLLDPVIIADISGNGFVTSTDTSRMLQAAVAISVPELPQLPNPAVSLVQGGPDPKLSLPAHLQAAPGDQLLIPVQIDSIVDLTGSGLESVDLVLYYDPAVLDVQGVTLGKLLRGESGWMINSNIDVLAGRIFVSVAGNMPLEGSFLGELVELHAEVKADAPKGSTALNLAASSRDPSRFTGLNEGYLTLIPAPTDADNDPGVDGRITIVAPSTKSPIARVIDGKLLVTGNSQHDNILISQLADGLLRVRSGSSVLGTFAAPGGIAVSARTGSDYIVVDAALRAVISASIVPLDPAEIDFIYTTDFAMVVDPNSFSVLPHIPDSEAHDEALLALLTAAPRPPAGGNFPLRRR